MKRALFLLGFLSLFCLRLPAQPSPLPQIYYVTTAPSGSCTVGQPLGFQVVVSTLALWSCEGSTVNGAGTWVQISSSGGGSAGGVLSGTYPNPGLASSIPSGTLANAGIVPVCVVNATTTLPGCVTLLTSTGGTIYIPKGSTASVSQVVLDNLSGITISGDNNAAGGLGASTLLLTGAASPLISAKGTFGVRLTNLNILWNNASFTGDVFNSSLGNGATSNLEIDHCYFGITGAGVSATNILNLSSTQSSNIHDNWFPGYAAVVILGANNSGDYTSAITIQDNLFNSGAGTVSASFIRNMSSGLSVMNNTFEISIGAGSPAILDQTVAIISESLSFGPGNWVGDTPAGYTNNFFNFVSGDVEGMTVFGNLLGGNTAASGSSIFNLAVPTFGLSVSGNLISGAVLMTSSANNTGVGVHYNNIAGGMTTGLYISSGNLNGLEWSGNSGSPTTYLSGTPASGYIQNASNVLTTYGGYRTLTNGTTATTQTTGDNSTKVATDAFVLANTATGPGNAGAIGYSGTPTVTATVYVPAMGAGNGSVTAANVGWPAPSASPISSLQVYSSSVPGIGNTLVVTLYDGSTAESLTCTITAAANSCSDLTHSFIPAVGDLLTWQISPTGSVIITPNIQISASWQTPIQKFFYTDPILVTQAYAAAVSTNNIRLVPFYVNYPTVLSNIAYDVTTADNTANSYDMGAFGPGCFSGTASIPLVFHTGTVAGTSLAPSTGFHSIAVTGAPITIQPGQYCFAWTSSATTPAMVIGGSTAAYALTPFASTLTSGSLGGATLPTTITAPALSWGLTGEVALGLY